MTPAGARSMPIRASADVEVPNVGKLRAYDYNGGRGNVVTEPGDAAPITVVVLAEGEPPRLSCRHAGELRVGRRFYVQRDDRLIGLMEVERVSGLRADCRVLFVVPEDAIRDGDGAVTRWR